MVTFVSLGHAAGVFSSVRVIQTGLGMRGKLHGAKYRDICLSDAEHCGPQTG